MIYIRVEENWVQGSVPLRMAPGRMCHRGLHATADRRVLVPLVKETRIGMT